MISWKPIHLKPVGHLPDELLPGYDEPRCYAVHLGRNDWFSCIGYISDEGELFTMDGRPTGYTWQEIDYYDDYEDP